MGIVKRSNSITVSKSVINGKSAYEIAVENGFVGTEAEWMESLKGEHFILSADSYTFKRDLRRTGPQEPITFSWQLSGSSSTPEFTIVPSTYTINSDNKLTVPYSNTDETITVTASVTGFDSQTIVLKCKDETEYNAFIGVMSYKPTELSSTQALCKGDYFVAKETFTDGQTFSGGHVYTIGEGGSWSELSQVDDNYANKMLTSLGGILDDGTIVQDTQCALYGYFKNLVAQNAVFDNIKAKLAVLTDVRIEGKSEFKGEITSSAFSTTVAEEGSTPITIGLSAENYWDYQSMERMLDTVFKTDGYFDVGGDYSQIRRGTGRIRMWYADGGKSATRTVSVTVPRTQNLSIYVYQGRVRLDGETVIDWNANTGKWYTLNVMAGQTLVLSAYWSVNSLVEAYDIHEEFSTKYSFFDFNGIHINSIGSGINVGTGPTVSYSGNSVTAHTIHKAYQIPSGNGGGQVNSGGKITMTRYDGSESIVDKDIYSVTWKNGEEITVITNDMKPYIITSSDHFLDLSMSFTVMTKIDSVSAVTILPKVNSSNIGSDASKFNAGYFKDVYADALMLGDNGLPSGDDGSIHLPNGMVMKWKFFVAQGGSSAKKLTWDFREAFPTACVFAWASQMSQYTSGDKYYGYLMEIDRTKVSFASWSAYPYYCFAIGL